MQTSSNGIKSLKQLEGVRTEMYRDSAGLPSIGVGHLLTKDELRSGTIHLFDSPVDWRDGLQGEEVDDLLRLDLDEAELAVNNGVNVSLTQQQYDALVSFAFNVGVYAFAHSTLLRRLNAGDYASVPAQLRRWMYSAGIIDPILVKRREAEVALWEGGA
jgi:lysozyme